MSSLDSDSDEEWDNVNTWNQTTTPAIEGVIAPALRENAISPTTTWDEDSEPWPATTPTPQRGVGAPQQPASHGVRLEDNVVGSSSGEISGEARSWVALDPPLAEGVISSNTMKIASTFDIGEGEMMEEDARLELEQLPTRGIGEARSEAGRLELVHEAREEDLESRRLDVHRRLPEAEGVLGEEPREESEFAETYSFAWEEEIDKEWDIEEQFPPPTRGVGAPMPPHLRCDSEGQLPMTAHELDLLQSMQEQDWVGKSPRKNGEDDDANATPSSFNTDKQYELMKDISMRFLPDFANDENRGLNVMIQEAERTLREMENATQEQDDRTSIMEDHMKRVQEEISATQQRVEAKKKEILTEEHLKIMTTFQAAQIKREARKMETEMNEMMEQLQKFDIAIVVGNDKLKKICQVQQWSQQELEQWMESALQKDEDYVALESYHKYDDTRLKALRLEETMCSGELAKYRDLLEAEMSETQSYQVALDKVAVEFRALHRERQEVIRQWEEAIELVHQRDIQIHKLTEEFSHNQQKIRKQKQSLDDFDIRLYNEQEKYADYEVAIKAKNLDAQKLRTALSSEIEKLKRTREALVNIKAQHLREQRRYANEVARKLFVQEENARQKVMLQDARENLQRMKKKVEDEYNHLDTLEKRTDILKKLSHTKTLDLKEAKKEVVDLQKKYYHGSNQLHSLRDAEGATIHEIKGGKSIAKTLRSKISLLEIELLNKQEKLYHADIQVQLLEEKVARASGQTSVEEDVETIKLVKELEDELATIKNDNQAINDQMKRSLNDQRKSNCRKEELEIRNKKLDDTNAELNLECDAGMINNKAMTKAREEVSLEADLLQMEVQRLTDLLHSKADEVFDLDCLKQRLIKNMEDRKAEVDNRQEIQKHEMKMIAEELHTFKLKRQNLIVKIDKLQCKFDCLVARMKTVDGIELSAEYFLQQMKSAREDIKKRGLILNQEVKKARLDVNFLESAEQQITTSNNNLRTSLTENERTIQYEKEAKILKEELHKARKGAILKEREERILIQELAELEVKKLNKEEEYRIASQTCEKLEYKIDNARKDQNEQKTKRKRAAARLNFLMRDLREKTSEEGAKQVSGEFVLSEMRESTKDVLYKLNTLAMDYPEYAPAITTRVQAQGFKLPRGPGSAARSASSTGGDESAATTPRRSGRRKSKSPAPPAPPARGAAAASVTNALTMEYKRSES